jgi:hypothetical protein
MTAYTQHLSLSTMQKIPPVDNSFLYIILGQILAAKFSCLRQKVFAARFSWKEKLAE